MEDIILLYFKLILLFFKYKIDFTLSLHLMSPLCASYGKFQGKLWHFQFLNVSCASYKERMFSLNRHRYIYLVFILDK